MKRNICMLLVVVAIMSLCACNKNPNQPSSENTTGNGAPTEIENAPPKLTDEELEQIEKYEDAVYALMEYEKTGQVPKYQGEANGEDIPDTQQSWLRCWYRDILKAECVEKWAEYASNDEINWNRQEVLDSFIVIEDVKLYEQHYSIDLLGNETTPYGDYYWYYNKDGLVSETFGIGMAFGFTYTDIPKSEVAYVDPLVGLSGVPHYTYDEAKRIIKSQFGSDKIYRVCEYIYDEKDNLTRIHITEIDGGEYDILYSYDQNDRLIRIDVPDYYEGTVKWTNVYSFSYNENGQVCRREYNETNRTDYFYNEEGVLQGGLYTNVTRDTQYTDEYAYSFDDSGRMKTITVTQRPEVRVSNGEVVDKRVMTFIYDVIYGDFYVYKPAEQN